MTLHIKIFLSALILAIFAGQLSLYSANTIPQEPLAKIAETMKELETDYVQHKVYLHTDKDEYLAGENIWIKAYLVDAITHKPENQSTNLNVELINSKGQLVSINLLRLRNGYSNADITLPDSLSEGNYRLRAYTGWMQNFDKDLYFSKDIFVSSPIEENFIRMRERRYNRRFNDKLKTKSEQMQFAFFPEGGYLVENMYSRLAFKAVNSLGEGQRINGVITDNDGNKVIEFQSVNDGMGIVTFRPEKGKRYKAEINFPNGQKQTVNIRNILSEGYVLKTNTKDSEIEIEIKSNFNPSDYNLSPELYIIAHIRGKTYFTEKALPQNNVYNTSIPLKELPAGICHIALFDSNLTPLAERLVFINGSSVGKANMEVKETRLSRQERLNVSFSFESIQKDKTQGSYSVAVLGSDEPFDDIHSNIASYLLLTSDIGKTIISPWYYVSGTDEEIVKALDLVMMVHGWRRFNWSDVLSGNLPKIEYGISRGITLRGEVTAPKSHWQSGEQRVELTIKKNEKSAGIFTTTTDNQGNFAFSGLDYEGIFTAELRVPGNRSQRTLDVVLTPAKTQQRSLTKNLLTRPHSITKRGDDWQRVSRPKYTITQPTIRERHEPTSMYGNADQTVYMEDIQTSYNNMMQILRTQVRGLSMAGNEILLRGPSSLLMSNEPLFMLDNSIVSKSYFLSINPREIERIDIFTGPSTSMFGVRGGNGVIIAISKREIPGGDAYIKYTLKGYSTPVEFFHSKIDIEKNITANVPRTLFWEPNLIPDRKGNARISFPQKDNWQYIMIIVEGIDEKGNITFDKYDLTK